MKKERVFLFLTIIGILILFLMAEIEKPIIYDSIKSISVTKNSVTISLESSADKIIILNETPIENLKVGDKIKIYGTREKSINETIVFATKVKR